MKAGAASYLPLRSWNEDETSSQHATDPLIGVLGALDALPEGVRVLSQLALVPAPSNWSRRYQRKAIEHALEPQRQQERQALTAQRGTSEGQGPGWPVLLLGGLLLLVASSYTLWKNRVPPSLLALVTSWLYGVAMPHSPYSPHPFAWGMPASLPWPVLVIGGIVVLLFIGIDQVRRRRRHRQGPIYDQDLVGQKTSQMAYRVRFRLYVIEAKPKEETTRSGQEDTSLTNGEE